jgi:hypothetical protein
MTGPQEAQEARAFLRALYDGKPDGSLIAVSPRVEGRWGRTSFYDDVEQAAEGVVGGVDLYARITALVERPPTGRGDETLSASIPGVWCELDVAGAPDGRGGVHEDG